MYVSVCVLWVSQTANIYTYIFCNRMQSRDFPTNYAIAIDFETSSASEQPENWARFSL